MVSDQIRIPSKVTAIVVPISGLIMLLHLVHGFALLEHFTSEHEVIDDLLESAEGRLDHDAYHYCICAVAVYWGPVAVVMAMSGLAGGFSLGESACSASLLTECFQGFLGSC